MTRLAAVLLLSVLSTACVQAGEPATRAQLVSGHDLMEREAIALQIEPIEQAADGTYRLIWHPWHQSTAALVAHCPSQQCAVSISRTDGYGTYSIGAYSAQRSRPISLEEYEVVRAAFARLATLEEQLETFQTGSDGKATRICLHASSYSLEMRENDQARMIYRHCHEDFDADLKIARPLIQLGWEKLPEMMEAIDPVYQYSGGKERTFGH